MELPDFSSLWEARNTLQKLQESLLEKNSTRNGPAAQRVGVARPIVLRHYSLYITYHIFNISLRLIASLKILVLLSKGLSRPRKRGPDNYPNYYSDGICGVSFGIAEPEFANPLATCCQLHFFTHEELDRHTAEHVPCPGLPGVEGSGCGRALHPSVLAFHLEVDHAPIVVEKTSNDIEHGDSFLQRWREARRRNYPTFERVQAKIREVGYRIERGQVLLTRKFGSLNSRKPQELRKPRDKGVNRPDPGTSRTDAPSNREEPKPPDVESRVQRPPQSTSGEHVERSTTAMEDGGGGGVGGGEGRSCEGAEARREEGGGPRVPLVAYDSDVSWSEQVEMDEGGATPPPPSRGKSLIEQLESVRPRNVHAEEDTENPPPASPVPTPSERRESRGTRLRQRRRRNRRREERPARHASDGRTAATTSPELEEETGVEVDEVSAKGGAKAFAAHPVVQMFAKRRACMRNASLITKRPTLLQMLLAEEMRHERNQLMQCVRYVVKNNFFLQK